MKSKFTFLLLLAICVLLLAGWFIFPADNKASKSFPNNRVAIELPEQHSIKSTNREQPQTATANSAKPNVAPTAGTETPLPDFGWKDTPEQKAELTKWEESRGDFQFSSLGDYVSYDHDALVQLGNSGDLKALSLLLIVARDKEQEYWLNKAMLYGSSLALTTKAFAIENQVRAEPNLPEAERMKMIVEAVAYGRAAKLRQDYSRIIFNNTKYYENSFGIKITEQMAKSIEIRANEIYSDLESQRIKMGLGKFDNSLPPAVESYFKWWTYLNNVH